MKDIRIDVNGTVISAESISEASGCPIEEVDVHSFLEVIAAELEPTKRLQIIVHEIDVF